MSGIISNILNFEIPHKYRILSISSDDYIVDNYLDLLTKEMDVDLWTYNTLRYGKEYLPRKCTILTSENIPLRNNYDFILIHNDIGIHVGRQLSNLMHVPLILWKHNHIRCKSFMEIASFDSNCMKIPVVKIDGVTPDPKGRIISRKETAIQLTPIYGDSFIPLAANFEERQLQYSKASVLLNLEFSSHRPEIDEAMTYGIPVISVNNPFHDQSKMSIFKNQVELDLILKQEQIPIHRIDPSTTEEFVSNFLFLCGLTKGYNHDTI